jgi:hypothetical protein
LKRVKDQPPGITVSSLIKVGLDLDVV